MNSPPNKPMTTAAMAAPFRPTTRSGIGVTFAAGTSPATA